MHEHGVDVSVLAVGAGCIALWALVARRLAGWNISSAMAMVVLGVVVANEPLDLIAPSPTSDTVRLLVEGALVLVLFSDASRVNVGGLRADRGLPARLLLVGLPLTIGLGFAAAALVTDLDLWLCALVAAALAPTDAALGAPVVADRHVPMRIRRTLNVESGLNDGLATPLVTFFVAGAVAEAGSLPDVSPGSALIELAGGLVVGVAVGVAGGWLLRVAQDRSWTSRAAGGIVVPALALFSYAAALELGGNGFVAAFVGGLAFGSTQRDPAEVGELGERLGELLGLVVWLLVGTLVVDVLADVTWEMVVFAVLALTVLRMAPVALALTGTGLSGVTVAFVGWFGPRGLASIVFALIALDALPAAEGSAVISMVMLTVVLSVVVHGLTAGPLARRYGARAGQLGDGQPEHLPGVDDALAPRRVAEHHHR